MRGLRVVAYFGRMPGPWMLLPPLFWLVALAAIVLAVYALLRRQSVGGRLPADPLQALGTRYARGEIDREQYLRMRQDLEGRGGPP